MKNEHIRNEIRNISGQINAQFWEIAPLLHACFHEQMHISWGFKSFREYIEKDIDFSIRKAQYTVRMWQWYLGMPKAAQKWAKTTPWSKLKIIFASITKDNWKEWRDICNTRAQDELTAYMTEYNLGKFKERTRETTLEKARKRINMHPFARASIEDRMAQFRNAGASCEETAEEFGITEKDTMETLRYLSFFIPTDVFEKIQSSAIDSDLSPTEELSRVISWTFGEEIKRIQNC